MTLRLLFIYTSFDLAAPQQSEDLINIEQFADKRKFTRNINFSKLPSKVKILCLQTKHQANFKLYRLPIRFFDTQVQALMLADELVCFANILNISKDIETNICGVRSSMKLWFSLERYASHIKIHESRFKKELM